MNLIREILGGLVSVLTITAAPLYRYPYRYPGEAMRGDWQKIGKDIVRVVERGDE